MWRVGQLVSVAQDDLDAHTGYTSPYTAAECQDQEGK